MLTVEQLKAELSDLLREIFEHLDGKKVDGLTVAVMESPRVYAFLAEELRKMRLEVPKPERVDVDWSSFDTHPLTRSVGHLWVERVAIPLLPPARALAEGLRRSREPLCPQDDIVTPQMLEQLRRHFTTKS